jgi:hypothetical protein|tara:strand:- start:2005 stop:2148 length:144 start_codon:yes stop_codon:yes gene_type:complete
MSKVDLGRGSCSGARKMRGGGMVKKTGVRKMRGGGMVKKTGVRKKRR